MVTLPSPNPIPNSGFLGYSYSVTPGTTITSGVTSNTVNTQVNAAIIQNEDGGLVKSLDKQYATLGSTIGYTVVLKNTGNITALTVTFTDTVPNNTILLPGSVTVNGTSQPSANPTAGVQVGSINPGAVTTVQFIVIVTTIPTEPIPVNSIPNTSFIDYTFIYDPSMPASSVENLSNYVYTFVNTALISIPDKSSTPSEVKIGDVITYTITIPNSGNVNANNVIFYDTIPQGTAFQAGSILVNGTSTSGNPQTGVNIGSIAAGNSSVVVFTVVAVSLPNPYQTTNQARVKYSYTMDPSLPNGETSTVPSNIVSNSIVGAVINNSIPGNLGKSGSPNYASIGDILTYTITSTNSGNIDANNVTLVDTLPSEVTLQSITLNGTPITGDPSTGINLGTLAPGATDTVVIKAIVLTLPATNPITNTGFINYTYTVNGTAITTGSQTNQVVNTVASAVISNSQNGLTKYVDKANASIGDILTYTIAVTNTGNTQATGVTLIDTIPGGTTFNAGSVTGGTGTPSGGITIGSINPNQTATVSFKVTVVSIPAIIPLPNYTMVGYSYINDPSKGPITTQTISNTVFTNLKVASISQGGGGLSKSVDLSYAKVFDTITYTIPMKNTGTVQADNVTFIDTIPGSTTFVPGSVTLDGVSNGGNPQTGISVGTIQPNQTVTLTFKVIVATIPTVNPIPNIGQVNYVYTVNTPGDSSATNLTNIVSTTVAQAYIRPQDGGLVKSVDLAYAD
ncbi:MAG: beta strand repeat-containing protein, partial [Clostridium sp.]